MNDLRAIGFAEVRSRLTGNRLAVLDALLCRGPSTGSELARAMGWTVLSVRPRIVELRDMFHAVPTGERRDGEHVFRGVTPTEAMALHEAARNRYAIEMRAQERHLAEPVKATQDEMKLEAA